MSASFYKQYGNSHNWSQEQELGIAILAHAAADLTGWNDRNRNMARLWVKTQGTALGDDTPRVSFEDVCNLLGVEPQPFRKKLLDPKEGKRIAEEIKQLYFRHQDRDPTNPHSSQPRETHRPQRTARRLGLKRRYC
jgi:hypothetical protein